MSRSANSVRWPFGWLLSECEPRVASNWAKSQIGDRHFAHSPSTPVAVGPDSRCVMIGFALDPVYPERTNEDICRELECLNDDEAQELIDRVVGRFILLRASEQHGITAQQDAMGLRTAYYTDPQYPAVIGSHMLLVASQVGAPRNQFGASGFLQESGDSTYPGMYTARLGVMRLTPNLEWMGNTQSVRRVFPRTGRQESTTAEVAQLIKDRADGQLQSLSLRGVPLMASLTAGVDSRVTASLLSKTDDVEYFTYDVLYQAKNRANKHDVDGARELAESLGLKHTILELADRSIPDDLKRDMDQNWPLHHSPKLAATYRDMLPDRLHIRSTGFGIGSAYWSRHGFGVAPLNAREMRRIASSRRGRSLASLDAFQQYINATDFNRVESLGYDPYDLFLWELRVGSWFASCSHESDIAHDTHVLLDSREILQAMLSVPDNERREDSVLLSILESADPAFLEVPINGVDRSNHRGAPPSSQEDEAATGLTSEKPPISPDRALSPQSGDSTHSSEATSPTEINDNSAPDIAFPLSALPTDQPASTTRSLDRAIEAALRQSDGPGFEDRANDARLATDLLSSTVHLAPHPPTQLTFPIDWRADPFSQRNWRAQLQMLRWIDPLRRVARSTPDQRTELMKRWLQIVKDWARENTAASKATPSAWLSMVEAIRAEALINGLPWTDDPQFILDLLAKHGEWLADEKHIGHSNHALRQHSALFQIGAVLGEDGWRDLAVERLRAHSEHMFDDEGMNSEGAVRYWEMNRRWALSVANRLEAEGVDASFIRGKLDLAAEALAFATRPDGKYEVLGDSDPSGPQSDGHQFLEYVSTNGMRGSAPESLARVYRRGFAFGRSGWGEIARSFADESFYSVIFANGDKVHGHHDAGSVTFYAKQHPLLVDAGKYGYVTSPERDYCFGRTGHNVITIDGLKYDHSKEARLVGHELGETIDFYVIEDRGYPGVTIRRTVAYSRVTESMLVVDHVGANTKVTARWRWHVNPDATVEIDGASARARCADFGYSLLWAGSKPDLKTVRGQRGPLEGWYSPKVNTLVPAEVVVASRSGQRSRTAVLIESESSQRRQLQSFPTKDGVGYVARGHGNVECLIVEGRSVRSIATDEESLPGLIKEFRVGPPTTSLQQATPAPTSPAQAREIDSHIREMRRILGHECTPDEAGSSASSLREILETGLNQGAMAALRDICATYPSVSADGLPRGNRPNRRGFDFAPGRRRVDLRGSQVDYQAFSAEELSDPHWDTLSGTSLHVYNTGSVALPVLFRPGSERKLLVCFAGAQDRAKVALPRLEWQRQFEDVDCAQLFVSDPTLDLAPDLRIGWYLGTAEVDLPKVLAHLVGNYTERLGIDDVWLMGTSGGGFAALQTGALIANSTPIAVNPQTDIAKYRARFSHKASAHVFGTPTPKTGPRTSVARRLEEAKLPVNMRIILNTGDLHHRRDHVDPLTGEVQSIPTAALRVDRVDWGAGHISKVPEIVAYVKDALEAR